MNALQNKVTLYFRQGPSDKIYQASIEPSGSGFTVNFAFGRRGSTLNTGTKTGSPVDLGTARKVFQKLVQEKKAKGYTEGPDGTPCRTPEQANRVSGHLPQLLNPIEETELERYLADAEWCLQEKFDGKRMLLLKQGNQVQAINRQGLFIGLAETILNDARRIAGDFLLDGEAVGEKYHAFDLLSRNGEDLRHLSCCWRLDNLKLALNTMGNCSIRRVTSSFVEQDKRRQLAALRQSNAEGVVLKNLNAAYTPGRPNSGGPALKYKFYATLSAVVSKVNTGRSVELRLLKKEGWVPVGNVTIPSNHVLPTAGQRVEVRYLYAFPESWALFQPVYLGLRNDIDHSECTFAQLKFKRDDEQ
jgi:bifunctional non-homologous end joining protein LigD